MPSFNIMAEEQTLEKSEGSFLAAFLSNIMLSTITFGIYAFLVARKTGIAVTDERIIIKSGGLLSSKTSEVRLDNVQSATETSGLILGLLGISALQVTNAGSETFTLGIKNTGGVRNAVNQAQRDM
jgi:uncharacterized membrane protein YdbT with pleckstrin-like domain